MSSTCLKDTPQDAAAIVQDAQIVELTQRLAQVTAERDQLRHQDPDRYEERIVELHSVIAELSRKLELGKDDVIPEESEIEEGKQAQCVKFSIFMSLRFYVKPILGNVEVQKMPFLHV